MGRAGYLPKARPIAVPRAHTPPRLRAREDRYATRAAPQERGRVGARPDLRGGIYQERLSAPRPSRRRARPSSPPPLEPRLLQRTGSAAIGTSLVFSLASPRR